MRSVSDIAVSRERFFRSIAENLRDSTEAEVLKRLAGLGIKDLGKYFAVCEISLKFEQIPPEKRCDTLLNAEKFFKNAFSHRIFVMPYGSANGNVAFILSAKSAETLDSAEDSLESILDDFESKHSLMGSLIAVGRTVANIMDVRLSAADAFTCLTYKNSVEIGRVIHIRDVKKVLQHTNNKHNLAVDRILGCFLDGNVPKLKKRLDELLSTVEFDTSNRFFDVRQTYIELITRILQQTADFGIQISESETQENIQYILHTESPNDIEVWFINCCVKYILLINSRKTDKLSHLIEQAKDYVAENYADINLSQQSASEFLNLSSAYFGQLFFSKTGSRFIDYVKEYRVNISKDMLISGNIKIKDISTAVGFTSVSYYNTVFKKITGVTPQEYRAK
ncbi:MAG: helix-turn-helix domain-containing protein [Clostridiales bacterium]|nr:helix-turn-helix domain-containing protein [Candidatus Equinaster intestinalis]